MYNRTHGTFEFIGTPQKLHYEADRIPSYLTDVVKAIKNWLSKNDRMSIDLIFKQLDKYNIGELNKDEFKSAFKKIGIDL